MGAPVLHPSLLQQALGTFSFYVGCVNMLPPYGEVDLFGGNITELDELTYGVARTAVAAS